MKNTSNNQLFCIELLCNFPFAADGETEIMLLDFLIENYPAINKKQLDKTLEISINSYVKLDVIFKQNEVVYYLNDIFIGNTGGHARVSLLKWSEFTKIVANKPQSQLLFLILLPFVVGEKEEFDIIKSAIEQHLNVLPIQNQSIIAKYLVNHCVFSDDESNNFYEDSELGILCKRNHSERNIANEKFQIKAINELIELAQK